MRIVLYISILIAVPAFAQINGTFDPDLPDASLPNYSGDQDITASISYPTHDRTVSASNTADCGAGGAQGTPADPFAFFVGGRVVWTSNLAPKADGIVVAACFPLEVSVQAGEYTARRDLVADHLFQFSEVTAIGSLPGGYPASVEAVESCSLIGYNGLGTPFVIVNDLGECVYSGGSTGVPGR